MNILPLFTPLNLFSFAELDFKQWIAIAVIAFIIILFIRRLIEMKNNKKASDEKSELYPITVETNKSETKETEKNEKASEPVYTGYVRLENISEQDAAVVMAITSHNTGIPLEKLGFCSIKLKETELINIEEQDAAVVMAIISDRTGISLDNLIFNSIKLTEEK